MKTFLQIVIILVLVVCISYASYKTEFFGLGKRVEKDTINIENSNITDAKDQETEENSVLGKLKVVEVQTGFNPYANSDGLFLPCVAIKFENTSKDDIKDYIKVNAVFIDNKTKEQIDTQFKTLTSEINPLTRGTFKQIKLESSTGWAAIQNQDVIVNIYLEGELIKSLKVVNMEFDGRIH